MLDKNTIKKVHCIGIGGIGVSGIAEFLHAQGFAVSGSDKTQSKITERLQSLGIKVFAEHNAKNLDDVDVVVYSSAIDDSNPELAQAKKMGVHLLHRAEMLAELMHDSKGIAVCGTHGKTTTTSLIAAVLLEAKLDPSFMIGGLFNHHVSPGCIGQGEYFVVEADESDASFLDLRPDIAVVTNIDYDHMDTYGGDFKNLTQSFLTFLEHLPTEDGLAVLCADDPHVMNLAKQIRAQTVLYGFNAEANYHAFEYQQLGTECRFKVSRPDNTTLDVTLNLPGAHNVTNATAAVALAHQLGVDDAAVQKALAEFTGVGRRFHHRGDLIVDNTAVPIIDDYGHHPGAINATLAAAKATWPDRRVVLAFQPHRYSRTQDLFNDFVNSLSHADQLLLCDVYSAGEKAIDGVSSQVLNDAVAKHAEHAPVYVGGLEQLPSALQQVLQPNDVLIMQGAGDISLMAIQLAEGKHAKL